MSGKRITSAVAFEVPNGVEGEEIGAVIQAVADLYASTSLDHIEFAHAVGFALTIHYKVHRREAANAHELKQFMIALIDGTWDKIELPMIVPEVSERQQ